MLPDLLRGAVVHPQAARPALDIHALRTPREGGPEYSPTDVFGEEEPIRPMSRHLAENAQFRREHILGLVHHYKIEEDFTDLVQAAR